MADETVTAANVLQGSSDGVEKVTWGATVVAGQVVVKRTDNKWDPGNADGAGTAELAGSLGLGYALNGGGDGQPGMILGFRANTAFSPGFTATEGVIYALSAAAAGGIAAVTDLVGIDDDWVTIIGAGDSNGKIVPIFKYTGAIV